MSTNILLTPELKYELQIELENASKEIENGDISPLNMSEIIDEVIKDINQSGS